MKAGLRRIGLSVESTDAESLRLLGKGHRPDQIYPAFRLLERLGLPCQINLIVFGPYATVPSVRADLQLLEYVRDSEVLSYSDAFPFNGLRAFPWSRVAVRLRREGLLDSGSTSCRFRDPDVARLAAFVAELERATRITFKHRALVAAADDATAARLEPLADAVRSWVGLSLLPRYVGAACDLVEDGVPGRRREAALAELAARFDADLGPLRALTGRA
jgi:hypothetical protein